MQHALKCVYLLSPSVVTSFFPLNGLYFLASDESTSSREEVDYLHHA